MFRKKDGFHLALGHRVGNSKANNTVGTKVVLRGPLSNIALNYHLLNFSINLLAFYHEYLPLIGYPTHVLLKVIKQLDYEL